MKTYSLLFRKSGKHGCQIFHPADGDDSDGCFNINDAEYTHGYLDLNTGFMH